MPRNPRRLLDRPPCSESLAMAASTLPSAIPTEGIPFAHYRWSQGRDYALRCPSIDPYFRYGVVALHQRRASLDWILLLDQKLKTQSPAARLRIRLSDDISDFGFFRADIAPDGLGIDRFQLFANQVQNEYFRIVALCANACS